MTSTHFFNPCGYFEWASVILAYFFLIMLGLTIILIFGLLCCARKKTLKKKKGTVGAIYSHLHYQNWLSRMIPIMFMVKRVIFAVNVFYMTNIYIPLFTTLSLLNMCLILHAKPYTDQSIFKIELFNEGVAIVFFTSLEMFKTQFLDPE